MIPARVIEAKRNGEVLDDDTLTRFFHAYLEGQVEEYQMASFLMAVCFRGLHVRELDTLVTIMVESGAVLDFSHLPGAVVDKHSTGGVGDKVSLVLAPLAAEMGLCVPMMSGRGLGHTGGTLDKLESIPGFQTDLTLVEFGRIVDSLGVAMVGQTDEVAPLDKRLYDLRSVTATVPAVPLIASSIMSKKLAEGLTGLVLDVKVGEGAFLGEAGRAEELARTMVGIGERRGLPTVALLTAMDRPLGRAIGNGLETGEALECLKGGGPEDLRALVLKLAAEMAVLGDVADDVDEGERHATAVLDGGGALARFARLVEAQGGDARVVDDPRRLPRAPESAVLVARRRGWIREVVPTTLGYGVVELGGGRTRLGDAIDPGVGFELHVTPGQEIAAGDRLGTAFARTVEGSRRGVQILEEAIRVDDARPEAGGLPLIGARIAAEAQA